jgi:flagellar basal-body rod modification protein FlgD
MTVPPILATYGTAAASGAPTDRSTTANALDKDAFLQLLVTSLKYQDPSSPMNTSELMAQTTQLSMMEALADLTDLAKQSFELQQRMSAAGLVGRQVTYPDGSATRTGLVTAVDLGEETPTLTVDGHTVALDAVTTIATTTTGSATGS